MSKGEATMSTDELLATIAQDDAPLASKELSILELGRRVANETDLVSTLTDVAADPTNRTRPPAMPSVSLAHLAAVALILSGNEEAERAAREIVQGWSDDERADLDWYLNALGGSGE